ncbi:MAG: response regulator [Agarilytica sp.]
MAENNNNSPTLSVESVSAVFAHDISTPLMTAKMNADLLNEYHKLIVSMLETPEAEKIPAHIKVAIEHAPGLIQNNIKSVQKSLEQYKTYLNCLQESEEDNAPSANDETAPLSNKSLKILLVDDEDIHHDIGEAVLNSAHNITHEKSGLAAIERCKEEQFDLVLMDMQMPDLSGPQTVAELRLTLTTPTLIIGLSSMPIQSKKQELLDCGFNGFLDKPLKLDRFSKLISSLATISS